MKKLFKNIANTAKTTAAVILLIACICTCTNTEKYIYQRQNDRISDMNRIAYYCLGINIVIHPLKQRLNC